MKWYNIVEKSLALCWKRNSMILGEKLPKFDLSLYENLVERKKKKTKLILKGSFPATVVKILTGEERQCMPENSEDH